MIPIEKVAASIQISMKTTLQRIKALSKTPLDHRSRQAIQMTRKIFFLKTQKYQIELHCTSIKIKQRRKWKRRDRLKQFWKWIKWIKGKNLRTSAFEPSSLMIHLASWQTSREEQRKIHIRLVNAGGNHSKTWLRICSDLINKWRWEINEILQMKSIKFQIIDLNF